jgi:DNA topoisomerase IA
MMMMMMTKMGVTSVNMGLFVLVGCRFQTLLLQGRFEGVGGTISYGPCQFPTLGFIVDRFKRRRDFRVRSSHIG